ncbi:MAG: NapC/NirT family cytochrome c [Balneolales bacterium]
MSEKPNKILYLTLVLLIAGGTAAAAIGVLYVDPVSGAAHDYERMQGYAMVQVEEPTAGQAREVPEAADELAAGERGFTVGELMRTAGIISVIIALIILFCIEFLFKDRIQQLNYRMLLLISLFVLPGLVGMSATSTLLETTKSVDSCASCHVMDPFVEDLSDPESTTLAARHYKNRWISQYQCYTCHTTYGAHGTFEGKRDGFRHWLLFVTRTYEMPMTYKGSYPNVNCVDCHGGSPGFENALSHQALAEELITDRVSCISCHGPAHPLPGERGEEAAQRDRFSQVHRLWPQNDTGELSKMLEAIP